MKIIFESKNFIFRVFEIEDVDLVYELDREPEIHTYKQVVRNAKKTIQFTFYMKKIFISFFIFSCSISIAQKIDHTKQCYRTADIIDPETEKIVDTKVHSEVCINFLSENNAKMTVANNEFILTFTSKELLEIDEKGNSVYKAIGTIGKIKFEIVFLVSPEYYFLTALIIMHNCPVPNYDKNMILQYKHRN